MIIYRLTDLKGKLKEPLIILISLTITTSKRGTDCFYKYYLLILKMYNLTTYFDVRMQLTKDENDGTHTKSDFKNNILFLKSHRTVEIKNNKLFLCFGSKNLT